MTTPYKNILEKLQQAGIRFALTGSYIIRDLVDGPRKDLDIVVHPDDEEKLVQTGLGIHAVYESPEKLPGLFQTRKQYIIVTEDGPIDCIIQLYEGFTYTDEAEFDIDPDTGFPCMKRMRLYDLYITRSKGKKFKDRAKLICP
jgi:hypothetical protein